MNRLLCLLAALLCAATAFAQKYEFDKASELVTIDGKPAFYIVKQGTAQFSIRDLNKQELIRVSNGDMEQEGRSNVPGFKFTFSASGNYCSTLPMSLTFNWPKAIMAIIKSNALIENGSVPEASERTFVMSNKGYYHRTTTPQVVVNVSGSNGTGTATPPPAHITVRGTKVYNNDEAIASFRQNTEGGVELVQVYNSSDQKVAVARHTQGKPDEDWSIALSTENRTVSVLYHADAPLERLFQYLSEKGYLK